MLIVASDDGRTTIPGAEYVSVFRELVGTEFADESMATVFAEQDGVKLIFGLPLVPDGLYLDTEKNRKIIEKYLNTGGLEHDKREDPVGAIKVDECMEE